MSFTNQQKFDLAVFLNACWQVQNFQTKEKFPWDRVLRASGLGTRSAGSGGMEMLKGFRNFLMHGDVVVAVGLVVALAFSNLVKAFTDNIINPLVAAAQGGVKGPGLGWQLVSGGGDGTFLNLGGFISAIIYFIIFMAVVYFLIVVPYKAVMARFSKTVFGDPAPTKTCPACRSDDLDPAASKCKHCGSSLAV